MIRGIQHNRERSYEWTRAVLETGVECRSDEVCLQEPPRGRGEVGISHSAYKIGNRK